MSFARHFRPPLTRDPYIFPAHLLNVEKLTVCVEDEPSSLQYRDRRCLNYIQDQIEKKAVVNLKKRKLQLIGANEGKLILFFSQPSIQDANSMV